MLFDEKSKGIAQAYLSMLEQANKKEETIDTEGGEVDDKLSEACGAKTKKEAIEITPSSKSEVDKKGMKDKEGGDEEEDEGGDDDKGGEIEIKIKTDKKSDKKEVTKEAKAVGSAYAIGMSKAMDSTGDDPPLEKSTIKKAHKIAKAIMKKESTVWNWDEILEASDEEIDALIEELDGEDLESFVSEFNELSEMYKKAPPNETTVKTGKEKLEPRAAAEKAFVDMHSQVDKDHPFDKDQHDQGVDKQAPTRPGDKRANEKLKSLKDIRK